MSRYIDADKLIKNMQKSKYKIADSSYQKGCNEVCDFYIDYLQKSTTADVKKVVRGEWIEKETISGLLGICSECKYPISYWHKSNYCPNCGADMKGEQHD